MNTLTHWHRFLLWYLDGCINHDKSYNLKVFQIKINIVVKIRQQLQHKFGIMHQFITIVASCFFNLSVKTSFTCTHMSSGLVVLFYILKPKTTWWHTGSVSVWNRCDTRLNFFLVYFLFLFSASDWEVSQSGRIRAWLHFPPPHRWRPYSLTLFFSPAKEGAGPGGRAAGREYPHISLA